MAAVRTTGLLCIALVLAGAVLPAQQPQLTGTASVLGRVLDAQSGMPIGGAIVTLAGGPNGPPLGTFIGADLMTLNALTDPQGRFVFRQLPKGGYNLTTSLGGNGFSVSGFVATGLGKQIGPYLNGGYGQRRPGGPMQVLELGEGQHVTDTVIRLWKGGAIDGTVRDETGDPITGIVVIAVAVSTDGRLLDGPSTRTDDRGAYHLGTLTPGRYLVLVPQTQTLLPAATIEAVFGGEQPNTQLSAVLTANGAPGPSRASISLGETRLSLTSEVGANLPHNSLAPRRQGADTFAYASTFSPSSVQPGQADLIVVRSGEERLGVDITLRPVRTVSVAGVLQDPAGPVPNFGVHLFPVDSGGGDAVLEVANTATDAKGNFTFPMVPAGQYTVVAVRNAAGPGAPPPNASLWSQPGAYASVSIAVGDQPVGGLSLTLRSGAQIAGRLEFKGTTALPPDAQRQTAISVIRIPPLFRVPTGPTTPSARFALTGEFAIRGVPPGRYVIRPPEIFRAWTLQSIRAGGRDLADIPFLIDGTDLSDVVLTYTDQPSEIAGVVRKPSGAADPDASVFLFPSDRARWTEARLLTRTFRTSRVAGDGAFRMSGIIPGEYFVTAIPDETAIDWPDAALLEKLAGAAQKVRVEPGQKQQLSLTSVGLR
jgi:hypothetical protein